MKTTLYRREKSSKAKRKAWSVNANLKAQRNRDECQAAGYHDDGYIARCRETYRTTYDRVGNAMAWCDVRAIRDATAAEAIKIHADRTTVVCA